MSGSGADTTGESSQESDEERPAAGAMSSSPSSASAKNDPCANSMRRRFRRLRLRLRRRSASDSTTQSLTQAPPSWHPPPGYAVSPPSVRLRSSMTVMSLDDSLSHRGLSRSRRRRAQKSAGDPQQLSSGQEQHGEDLSVSFGRVQIRQYERIPGDNPSICFGVPLAIGWAFNEEGEPVSVEEHESRRGHESKKRDELYVPLRERERMLTDDWGISRSAVRAAERNAALAGMQRRATVARLHLEPAQEAIESARKKFDRVAKRKSTKKEEERMWREAQKRTASAAQHPALNDSSSRRSHSVAIVATEPDDADEGAHSASRCRSKLLVDNRHASGRTLRHCM